MSIRGRTSGFTVYVCVPVRKTFHLLKSAGTTEIVKGSKTVNVNILKRELGNLLFVSEKLGTLQHFVLPELHYYCAFI